jgi:hypothetical protein
LHIGFHRRQLTKNLKLPLTGARNAAFRASGLLAGWVHYALDVDRFPLRQSVIKPLVAVKLAIGAGVLALPWTAPLYAGVLASASNDFIRALRSLVSLP